MLAVRGEGDRVDGLLVSGQRVQRDAPLDIPQPDGRVERGRGQDEVGVRVRGSGSCARPLDGVDLLGVSLEIVQAGVPVHAPDLEGHVVGAASQELALRVPFDRVNLKYSCKLLVVSFNIITTLEFQVLHQLKLAVTKVIFKQY